MIIRKCYTCGAELNVMGVCDNCVTVSNSPPIMRKYIGEPNYVQWKAQTIAKFNNKDFFDKWEKLTVGWTHEQHRDFLFQEMPKLVKEVKI